MSKQTKNTIIFLTLHVLFFKTRTGQQTVVTHSQDTYWKLWILLHHQLFQCGNPVSGLFVSHSKQIWKQSTERIMDGHGNNTVTAGPFHSLTGRVFKRNLSAKQLLPEFVWLCFYVSLCRLLKKTEWGNPCVSSPGLCSASAAGPLRQRSSHP